MKIFVTVLLASIALATADVSSLVQGYNYPTQQAAYPQGNAQQQQQPLIMQIITGPAHQQQQHRQQQQQPSLIQLPFTSQLSQQYLPSNQQPSHNNRYQQNIATVSMALPMPVGFPGPNFVQPAKSVRRYRPRVKVPKKPIVTKNFFIHAAPEETDEDVQEELSQLAQQPRKHYNVLFVKTPTQTSKAAAINLAKSLKQEKTVVYVLSKKTSATDLQDAIAEAPQHINKPEVFFIKYRTPEEAANAQHQIQTQYDSLGGSSTITDEGVAPVTSVVGSLDAPEEDESEEEQQQQGQGQGQGQQLSEQDKQQQYDEQLVNTINSMTNQHQYLPPNQY